MQCPASLRRPSCKPLVAALALLALAGCAQNRGPGYYEPGRESTQTDAQLSAQGGHYTSAPSQLQFGFGGQRGAQPAGAGQQAQAQAGPAAAVPAVLAEPKTFLGTIPCLTGATANCPAQRVTLTLAPTGEWRYRSQLLDKSGKRDLVGQGCWQVIGSQPTRILLEDSKRLVQADLIFESANVLRVAMFDNIQPAVPYTLTRQANIDPINELTDKSPLICGKKG